ncbi:MAG: hypothetical protein GY711_05875 [bacterium]|nr:hypothetical protein [bacterium]
MDNRIRIGLVCAAIAIAIGAGMKLLRTPEDTPFAMAPEQGAADTLDAPRSKTRMEVPRVTVPTEPEAEPQEVPERVEFVLDNGPAYALRRR